MKFAQKLAVLRWRQGWSQEELADRMDVSSQTISEWESEFSSPDLDQILRLSQLLDTSIDTLLKEDYELEPLTAADEIANQPAAAIPSVPASSFSQSSAVQADTDQIAKPFDQAAGTDQQIPNDAIMPEIPTDPVIDLYTAKKYLEMKEYTAPKLGRAIGFFVASPAALLLMIGLAVGRFRGRGTLLLILAGVFFMLVIVALGVYSIVQLEALQKPYTKLFKDGYMVDNQAYAFATRVKEEWHSNLQRRLAAGIACCIISPAPLLFMIWFLNPFAIFLGISLMLLIVAFGVSEIVTVGNLKSALNHLLQEEGPSGQEA